MSVHTCVMEGDGMDAHETEWRVCLHVHTPTSRTLFDQSSAISKLPVKNVLYTKPIAGFVSLVHLPAKHFHYQRAALCLVGAMIYDLG